VSTTAQLHAALANARAGDEIVLAGGLYLESAGSTRQVGKNNNNVNVRFFASAMGTEANPIYLRSADPKNPAVLDGGNANGGGYVFYLKGADYWVIEDLEIRNAQKGIVFDKSNHGIIRACHVYNSGLEAIAIRDSSSYNLIEYTKVTRTGLQTGAIYNEGIYIGSSYSNWSNYDIDCDYNIVSHCVLGPDVKSKHYTDKEGCTGNIVQCTTFYGAGLEPANSCRSFMELQGNESIVRYNTFYRQGNPTVTAAIKIYEQQTGWGQRHDIHHNTFYLDIYTGPGGTGGTFIVEIVSGRGSCRLSGNVTFPAECLTYYRPTNILTSNPGAITVY
jgi:hypothetical protein